MIRHHLDAAALAFWSYDTANVVDKINEAYKGRLHPHFVKNPDGSHFYGMVTDPATNTAWLASRGTAGDTPAGNMHSWLHNANVFTGDDGMHNGFQTRANIVFDRFKSVLPQFRHIKIVGQSQGSGASQILAKLCCENLSAEKDIEFIVFAAPPSGTQIFADTVAPYFQQPIPDTNLMRLSGTRYIMPGDPIASPVLRNPDSWLLNGVDIGNGAILPDIIQYKIGPAELAMHSCRVYTTGMAMQMCADKNHTAEDFEFIGRVFDWCVN